MAAETDVPLVAAACVYVAAKAEETAIHIKVVVTEARATFNGMLIAHEQLSNLLHALLTLGELAEYGIVNFPSDSTKLAEMEFCEPESSVIDANQISPSILISSDLIEDLEFNLIIYHPYRSLVHMTGRDTGPIPARETTLDMDDNSMQMAW